MQVSMRGWLLVHVAHGLVDHLGMSANAAIIAALGAQVCPSPPPLE